MLNIVDKGPHIPMYQPIVKNVLICPLKQKLKANYDYYNWRLIILDVKARAAIENSLPCHVYHLVQKYKLAQERIERCHWLRKALWRFKLQPSRTLIGDMSTSLLNKVNL